MAILSKACKSHNFEWHNSLKLSIMNIWRLPSNFVSCDSISSGNFSVRDYFPLIRKDSSTHMHGLAVYKQDLVLRNSADSYLCFRLALLHSVSYFFFLYQSSSLSLRTVFGSISSNIDEVLSINPSANVFIFGDFNIHHKDWLIYSGGTDHLVSCYNFSVSNDLTQLVNFPTRIPDWFS